MLLPPALGFSPHPPVSVYGTGTWYTIAAFLGSRNRTLPYLCSVRVTDSDCETDLPVSLLPCLPGALFPGCAVLLRPHSSDTMRYRNLNLLSIGYAFRPLLRPRLTQGRSALPWKPWIFGREDSNLSLATHSGILSSYPSTAPSGTASSVLRMLIYQLTFISSTASVLCFSPGHFRRRTSRPVSCYALFECMAASEPTSWLSSKSHILFHLTRTLGP